MIYTGEFKMFGQLEEQADAGDIEAFGSEMVIFCK